MFVIEAKFQSGKSDLQGGIEDLDDVVDQLPRQWLSLRANHAAWARVLGSTVVDFHAGVSAVAIPLNSAPAARYQV